MLLVNDWGAISGPFAGRIQADSPQTMENSQCQIDAVSSQLSTAGDTLDVTVHVTYRPDFAGDKIVYLMAYDRKRQTNTGWIPAGTWTATR